MSIDSAALRLLLTRRRTRLELSRALLKKGYDEGEVEKAVLKWQEKGYIDHADYARRFVHDQILLSGYGPKRIRAALFERGVEGEIIEAALSGQDFGLSRLMAARFGESGAIDQKTEGKIMRHFIYRGFPPGEIKDAIKEIYTSGEE